MTTASLSNAATYTLLPSALTATAVAPTSAAPFVHEPPVPSSLKQAAVPAFCWIVPVTGSRSNTATALLCRDAT